MNLILYICATDEHNKCVTNNFPLCRIENTLTCFGWGGISILKDVENVLIKLCDVLVVKYIVAADR